MKKTKVMIVALVLSTMMSTVTWAGTTTPDGKQVESDGALLENGAQVELSTTTSVPATVLGEGVYEVGKDIAAGEYVLFRNDWYVGYYSVNKDSTGKLDGVTANGTFSYNAIVSVKDGEYLELTRCSLSPIAEVPQIDYTKGTMFKVGYHIPAGKYKLQDNNEEYGGYYAIYHSLEGGLENIAAIDIFHGQTCITVEEGQYLELNRCAIVEKE